MDRGQATHWFATYGWAFLLLLIAVGTLIHFNVIDLKGFSSSCRFDATFSCNDYVLQGSSLSFLLSNTLTTNIENVNITVITADTPCNQTIVVGSVPANSPIGPYVFCAGTQFAATTQGTLLVTYKEEGQTLFHVAKGTFLLHRKA
jgi:hypothetical protein